MNGDISGSDYSININTNHYHPAGEPIAHAPPNLHQLFFALTKKLKEPQIETLCQAIKHSAYDGKSTSCVLVPRSLIEGLDPHVIACRLWRWSDLRYAIEIKRIPSCPNEMDPIYVCCNPTHWYRICGTGMFVCSFGRHSFYSIRRQFGDGSFLWWHIVANEIRPGDRLFKVTDVNTIK